MSRPKEHGIVLSGTGGVWRVRTGDARTGVVREAVLRGRLKHGKDDWNKLVVGDRVVLEENVRGGIWAVTGIEPRVSCLARREPGGRYGERIAVANLDQVVIVFAATNPEPHRGMLDRFLVIAEGNRLHPRIVINKIELVGEPVTRDAFADYVTAGYPVHFTSASCGIGLGPLHDAFAGRTSALSGPSGVGKSSLLNAMYPGLDLRVGEVSRSVNKGRHTTVGALLYPLPDGGYVADTPGLREVGVWGLPADDLAACFPEFHPFLGDCRFRDCSHRTEPGCSVRAAVEQGEVSPDRYRSYLKLRGELEETARAREYGR